MSENAFLPEINIVLYFVCCYSFFILPELNMQVGQHRKMRCQWQRKKKHKPEVLGDSLPSFSEGKPERKSSWWLPPAGSEETHLSPSSDYCYPKRYWQPEEAHLGSWYTFSFMQRQPPAPEWARADHKWLQSSGSSKGYPPQPSQEKKNQGSNRDKHSPRVNMAMPITSARGFAFLNRGVIFCELLSEDGLPQRKRRKSSFAALQLQWGTF